MDTKTSKRVYLSEKEIRKTFCNLKTEKNELTGLDLLANLITKDVAIAFNDRYGIHSFRSVEINCVGVGTREDRSTGEKVGSILANFTVFAEDEESEIVEVESTGMFCVYRIGKIIMAELSLPDTIYFGEFMSEKIINGEVTLADIFGGDYNDDDDDDDDDFDETKETFYVFTCEGDGELVWDIDAQTFEDYDDAVAYANAMVKNCEVVRKFVDDGNYIWNLKKGERISIVRNYDNEDLYMTDICILK